MPDAKDGGITRYSTVTFALDDGDVGVHLPPELGVVEGDHVRIERRDDGVLVISRLNEENEIDR